MTAPTTSFEDSTSDWPAWTPLAEEATFLAAVAAGSDRVLIEDIDTTHQGRSIRRIRIGYPSAPTNTELHDARNVLFVATQHGYERGGREAALQAIRDLAYTTDPALTGYLAAHPVIFIPTASPDSWALNSRVNALIQNSNAGHLDYQFVESRAIGQTIHDYNPQVIIDQHEHTEAKPPYAVDAAVGFNNAPDIVSVAADMRDATWAALTAAGHTPNGSYGSGGSQGLGPISSARNHIFQLFETWGQGDTTSITFKQAVAAQRLNIDTIIAWHAANHAAVASAIHAARGWQINAGAAQAQFNAAPGAYAAINPGPAGYRITAEQAAAIATAIVLHELHTSEIPGSSDIYITMAQPSRAVIPNLLDTISPWRAVDGTRLMTEPEGVIPYEDDPSPPLSPRRRAASVVGLL